MELFNANVCAPNVTLEDVIEGKCQVDHFIPIARGGRDDQSNFWLVLADDNNSRQTKNWFDYWDSEYPNEGRESLEEYIYRNRLRFLLDMDLSFAGKHCTKCKELLPWSAYALDPSTSHPDGVKSDCKTCRNARENKLRKLRAAEKKRKEETEVEAGAA